jgi:hypothetical protein
VLHIVSECSTVDREEPADRVVGDEQETIASPRVPRRQRARQTHVARAQHTEPAAVDEDATALVDDRSHRRSRRDLRLDQGILSSVGRRQDFHRANGRLDPITDQRSMAGTAPTDFQFTRTLDAGPVHCSVWL